MDCITAKFDYDAATDKELSFDKDEQFTVLDTSDTDWLVRRTVADIVDPPYSSDEMEGYVPCSYFKVPDASLVKAHTTTAVREQLSNPSPTKSERSFKFQRALSSLNSPPTGLKITAQDVISAMTSMPTGFRRSSFITGSQIPPLMHDLLIPKLNSLKLGYEDVDVDPVSFQVSPVTITHQFAIALVSAKHIPRMDGVNYTILNRYVNIAMIDKGVLVSNVVSVQASPLLETSNSWTFSGTGALFPKDDKDALSIRTNSTSPDLSILFELVLVIAHVKSGKREDVSSGWTCLNVCRPDGAGVDAKVHELKVHGGTPLEDAALDTPLLSAHQSEVSSSLWQTLRRSSVGTPRLDVRVWSISDRLINSMQCLPKQMISHMTAVPFLAELVECIVSTIVSREDVHIPVSTVYAVHASEYTLALLDTPDTLLTLSILWAYKFKSAKSADNKSISVKCARVTECLMSLYASLCSHTIPQFDLRSTEKLMDRERWLKSVIASSLDDRSTTISAVSQWTGSSTSVVDVAYTPFNMFECVYHA